MSMLSPAGKANPGGERFQGRDVAQRQKRRVVLHTDLRHVEEQRVAHNGCANRAQSGACVPAPAERATSGIGPPELAEGEAALGDIVQTCSRFGIGSLHSALLGLVQLLSSKDAAEPLIINLSLALMPALEQLPSIWYGSPIVGLPGCSADPSLQFMPDLPRLSSRDVTELIRRYDPLSANGLAQFARSSSRAMEAFAADAGTPSVPARYSNRAEVVTEITRTGVSVLAGELAPDGRSPLAGLLGLYSATEFSPMDPGAPPRPDEYGWAEWAGRSFAMPIISGLVADLRATRPDLTAREIL